MDFEFGTSANWQFFVGTVGTLSFTPTTLGTNFAITSGSGTDQCCSFPVVGAGIYSLRIGDTVANLSTQKAVYYIHVPASGSYSLVFRVALVLRDSVGLPSSALPNLTMEAFDSGLVIPCANYYFTVNSIPGFTSGTCSTYVYCLPWQTHLIDLNDYAGKTIRIEFKTSDGQYAWNFGYGYIDMTCGLFAVSTVSTCGSTVQLTAPSGFVSYAWYDSSTFSTSYGTTSTITVTTSSSPTHYAVIATPAVGYGCPDTLYTTVFPNCTGAPAAGSVNTTATSACASSSFTLADVGYTPGIYYQWQSSPDSLTWSDIAGATNTTYTSTGISATTYYRLKDSCCASTLTAFSPGVKITYVVCCAGTISGTSTISAGNNATLSETISGGTWSSGNTAVATIDPLNGVCAGISAGTAVITYTIGCGGTTTYTVTVTSINGISGHVNFTGSPYSGNLKVWLITYSTSAMDLEAVDSTSLSCSSCSNAYYQFTGPITDSYRVKAAVMYSPSVTTGYVPTYHTSSFYWNSANVIYHTSGTADINEDINMLTGTPTTGPGFIAGNVTTGANRGTSTTGIPVVGLSVNVFDSGTSQLLQSTTTNASGSYSFSNLPLGSYYVFPDSLNYLTTPYTSITLTSGSATASSVDFIQHTISGTITPVTTAINNINSIVSSVIIYPNPATNELTISMDDNAYNSFTITDNVGQVLLSQHLAESATKVNVKDLPAGMYYVTMKGDTGTITKKFVKM